MKPTESQANFLNAINALPEEVIVELLKISKLKTYQGNTQIVKLNEMPSKIYVLVTGIVRSYLSTESGKEFNKNF